MATYVMADIHGEIDRFHAMLDLINFSADDQLYIIGDVIDRGAEKSFSKSSTKVTFTLFSAITRI